MFQHFFFGITEECVDPSCENHPTPDGPERSRKVQLRSSTWRQCSKENDADEFLFFRSLMPYIKGLPTVAKLSLRAEITNAVMKAWEKRQHQDSESVDTNRGESKLKLA